MKKQWKKGLLIAMVVSMLAATVAFAGPEDPIIPAPPKPITSI